MDICWNRCHYLMDDHPAPHPGITTGPCCANECFMLSSLFSQLSLQRENQADEGQTHFWRDMLTAGHMFNCFAIL